MFGIFGQFRRLFRQLLLFAGQLGELLGAAVLLCLGAGLGQVTLCLGELAGLLGELLGLLGADPSRVRRVAARFASPTPLDSELRVNAFGIKDDSFAFEANANGATTITHGRLELRQ